jgi:hypothetical protein
MWRAVLANGTEKTALLEKKQNSHQELNLIVVYKQLHLFTFPSFSFPSSFFYLTFLSFPSFLFFFPFFFSPLFFFLNSH